MCEFQSFQMYWIGLNGHHRFIPSLQALPCCSLLQSHRGRPPASKALKIADHAYLPGFSALHTHSCFSCRLYRALPLTPSPDCSASPIFVYARTHTRRGRQMWLRRVLSGQHDVLKAFRIRTPSPVNRVLHQLH